MVPTGPPPDGPGTIYGWLYGNPVTAPNTKSTAPKSYFAIDAHTWGYQEQVNGSWVWHHLGGDPKPTPGFDYHCEHCS
jgi:hypothetical protein